MKLYMIWDLHRDDFINVSPWSSTETLQFLLYAWLHIIHNGFCSQKIYAKQSGSSWHILPHSNLFICSYLYAEGSIFLSGVGQEFDLERIQPTVGKHMFIMYYYKQQSIFLPKFPTKSLLFSEKGEVYPSAVFEEESNN